MDKKEFSISLVVIGLTILFAFAACALFLSKGKSKFWTAKKMKFGAMILTITATAATQKACVSCYDPPPMNEIRLNLANDTINLNDSSKINGYIYMPESEIYSFKITDDSVFTVQQSENIFADDGAFDENSEEFTIQLNDTLKTGNYHLHFYDVDKNKQDSASPLWNEYYIHILND